MDLRPIQREAERLLGELRKLHTQMEEAWRDSINREQCPSRSGCLHSSGDRVTIAADILLAVAAGIAVHATVDEAASPCAPAQIEPITDADLAVAGDPRA